MAYRLAVVPDEALMQQVVSQFIDKLAYLELRHASENFQSKTVVLPQKHTTMNLWWFDVDKMLNGIPDYSKPAIMLIISLVENISAAKGAIQSLPDYDSTLEVGYTQAQKNEIQSALAPHIQALQIVEVADLVASGFLASDLPSE